MIGSWHYNAVRPSVCPSEALRIVGICDCMRVSFDPRERTICALAMVTGRRGAVVPCCRPHSYVSIQTDSERLVCEFYDRIHAS